MDPEDRKTIHALYREIDARRDREGVTCPVCQRKVLVILGLLETHDRHPPLRVICPGSGMEPET